MEKATKMMNILSAVIMVVAGAYINEVFGLVLSSAVKALIWVGVLTYSAAQLLPIEYFTGRLGERL